MTIAMQETSSTMLTQARWPAGKMNAGGATVALARGVDRLAWAKAKKSMDDTAMTNPEHWQEVDAEAVGDDVRMDKVERLRATIANGTYSVSAEALADKMIEHMREVQATELHKGLDKDKR